jgi:site-specific DNA-cytosine methylase
MPMFIESSQLRCTIVQTLQVQDIDGQCDIWTMSPPCQPCKYSIV